MDDSMRRHHERNGTAHQFGTDNAADLPVGHPAIQLFTEIGVHNANAAAKDAAFTQKFGSSKAATVVKTGVATAVLTWIARNADAADAMRDLHIGIEKQFPPPRKLSKVALLARGRADYAATAANEADFVMYGNFPADFRTQLNTAWPQVANLNAVRLGLKSELLDRVCVRQSFEADTNYGPGRQCVKDSLQRDSQTRLCIDPLIVLSRSNGPLAGRLGTRALGKNRRLWPTRRGR